MKTIPTVMGMIVKTDTGRDASCYAIEIPNEACSLGFALANAFMPTDEVVVIRRRDFEALKAAARVTACCLLLTVCLCLSSCVDSRVKREASLLNVKTHVATTEYNQAVTPADKCKVADEYFRDAQDMSQIINDGLLGNKPTPATPSPIK